MALYTTTLVWSAVLMHAGQQVALFDSAHVRLFSVTVEDDAPARA